MKVCIVGTGRVGSVLGEAWGRKGHDIVFGTRDPGARKVKELVARVGASAASPAGAASGADAVVLATPGDANDTALGDLAGTVLVDCTNPVAPDLSGLATGPDGSAGEQVARLAPGARVVKALNTTGSANMADPVLGGERCSMLYCGDDDGAKDVVRGLLEELGFEPCDAGPLRAARLLEHLALLWIHLAYARGFGTDFAFRVIRRG